jgi:hypothetical protein
MALLLQRKLLPPPDHELQGAPNLAFPSSCQPHVPSLICELLRMEILHNFLCQGALTSGIKIKTLQRPQVSNKDIRGDLTMSYFLNNYLTL